MDGSRISSQHLCGGASAASLHFFEVEYTTAVKGLPHSKQLAFNRDVINPQDGHILCDPYPATRGFSLRIHWSSRIVKRATSKPKEILVAFIKATLPGEFCIDRSASTQPVAPSGVLTSRS